MSALIGALVGSIIALAGLLLFPWNTERLPQIDSAPIFSALVEMRIIDIKPDPSTSEAPQLSLQLQIIDSDGNVRERLDSVHTLTTGSDIQSQISFKNTITQKECRSLALRASVQINAGASLVMARIKADGKSSNGKVTLLGLTEPIRIGVQKGSSAEVTIPFDCSP